MYIDLIGEVVPINSVTDESGVKSSDGLIEIKASPNIFSESAIIDYSLKSSTSSLFNLYLVDLAGSKILDLVNSSHGMGSYQAELKTEGLSAGTYFIIGSTGKSIVKLPVKVIK